VKIVEIWVVMLTVVLVTVRGTVFFRVKFLLVTKVKEIVAISTGIWGSLYQKRQIKHVDRFIVSPLKTKRICFVYKDSVRTAL
jgi:hypothetical protein